MVTAEQLAARQGEIARSPDLTRLVEHLTARAAPSIERLPAIPEQKALLSVDGGVCPNDGTALQFDPWSPSEHRCPRCGERQRGERHDRWWAKWQHLWLGERAAHLAALQALTGNAAAGVRAREILAGYAQRYWRFPNRDNVLGPSRLFFSTYLESIWILNYLAAATLLREAGQLDEATAKGVAQVADEAANLIGEYHEGFSNRQTWNNAALAAIAVWFEDEALATSAIEGQAGLLDHLRAFRSDGMWYEGENYHLFALRGMLTGMAWAEQAGIDCFADERIAGRLVAALTAPTLSALPDFTFPARKDSRYGVSLAQPSYLELWEVGLSRIPGAAGLSSWLSTLYRLTAPAVEQFESYLHDAGVDAPTQQSSRSRLSWWSLLNMSPVLTPPADPWQPKSVLLADTGLAILRQGDRYTSLECGPTVTGHGHPDRLHLTLHADGIHWLPDPGTGSYVSRSLFWYRSTVAHNAPRLDGRSQQSGEAGCEAFEAGGEWGWVRGRWGNLSRTVVSGPRYLVDVIELGGSEDHLLEVPWHFGGAGGGEVRSYGRWEPGELTDEFVSDVERFVPEQRGPITVEVKADGRWLTAALVFEGDLLRARGPGLPRGGGGGSEPSRATFYLCRVRGRNQRLITVLEPTRTDPSVSGVRLSGDVIAVDTTTGTEQHRIGVADWTVETKAGTVRLAGGREPASEQFFQPILAVNRPDPATGAAMRLENPPPLNGTPEGFDTSEPLTLDLDDHYRRSEEPYPGPEDFSARAYAGWDDRALYLCVEVVKPDSCFRPATAAPLRLDNEPDDIHSDGVQVYLRGDSDDYVGFLVVPEDGGGLRVRTVSDALGDPAWVTGAWQRPDRQPGGGGGGGYCVTLAIAWPEGGSVLAHVGGRVGFDLIVNEMLPGRDRRAGQLVWTGGNGWVWLRGDRQDPDRLGTLELVG